MPDRLARLSATALALSLSLWTSGAVAALPCGTLAEHETWGGHTKARHVHKDRKFLQGRIDDEGIYAASTFESESTAETAIGAALTGATDLDTWKNAKKGANRKVVKHTSSSVTGKSLTKGHEAKDALSDVKSVTVVLQKANNKCKYRIVTAFPTK